MPALVMRGRYLMREFFGDSALFRRLDPREREILVGLWMLADDDGWLPRDIPAIAAAIYRYEDASFREGWIRKALDQLAAIGKAEKHRCCVRMTSVAEYPRAGSKSFEHRDAHRNHSTKVEKRRVESSPVGDDSSPSPDPTQRDPSLPDPDVAGARATEPRAPRGGLTRFADLVAPPPGHRVPRPAR